MVARSLCRNAAGKNYIIFTGPSITSLTLFEEFEKQGWSVASCCEPGPLPWKVAGGVGVPDCGVQHRPEQGEVSRGNRSPQPAVGTETLHPRDPATGSRSGGRVRAELCPGFRACLGPLV